MELNIHRIGISITRPKKVSVLEFSSRSVEKMNFFEEISEYGIFHGIAVYQENKPLNIKDKKGLFTIEWE
ncbi:MAG: hypothetical protein JAY75_24310 [Candidatus Thiodiazotropha taylori]|nr:hypothetical protein [Candidatus Thiodiazotropha taylori]MCW4226634.1 hypothetical protein [Candidatus Thiodiazotropha endolucinida]MCG8033572.1 hypothetical protein [Candidatus Thiodiazotropha taylori]MCG8079330.1 hypothetical protein [Candidatus Thiodiazotropha taylori]MCG8111096.1 hypothetical protein [Candidatus Thiodiazotropha taylori]